MENELTPFDYGTVDAFEADRLKQHEAVILKSAKKMSDAAYEIGEELQAAHDELANHKNGTFFAWCESIGIKRTQAQDFMSYHDFICRNAVNKSKLESLPKRLIVDANRPSTPQELKDGVANGDITTLPQFKKLKAELEETKNVLRTTESKLDGMEHQVNMNIEAKKQAEQWRDEAINDCNAAKEALMGAEDERDQAIKERDDAQAELENLRETVRRQADELAERPQVEVEKRVEVEVIPDEYKKAFMENQRTHKELAAFKAHSQNMTVQELAQNDKEFSDLRKSEAQEREVAKRLEQFTFFSDAFPEGPIESRDLVTCYMKYHWHEDAIVNGILTSIKHVKDVSEWIYNEFIRQRDIRRKNEEDITKSRLEVVK